MGELEPWVLEGVKTKVTITRIVDSRNHKAKRVLNVNVWEKVGQSIELHAWMDG